MERSHLPYVANLNLLGEEDQFPAWPSEMTLEGSSEGHAQKTLFNNDLAAVVYQTADVKLSFPSEAPWPIEEVVMIVQGEMRVQAEGEAVQTLKAGELAFIPRGMVSSSTMLNGYRDFAVSLGAPEDVEETDLMSLQVEPSQATTTLPGFAGKAHNSFIPIPMGQMEKSPAGYHQWPADLLVEGGEEDILERIIEGDILVDRFQSRYTKVQFESALPFDEVVFVVEGEMRITVAGEGTVVFPAGSVAILPKGDSRPVTVEMKAVEAGGYYREVVVIPKAADSMWSF